MTIRLRSSVREERPSRRSSRASEARPRRVAAEPVVMVARDQEALIGRGPAMMRATTAARRASRIGIGRACIAETAGALTAARRYALDEWGLSIQPASSTAPARRNISQGERASGAGRKGALCASPRSAGSGSPRRRRRARSRHCRAVDQQHLLTMPAAAPGTSAARVATVGCSIPSVGMITLSIEPRAPLQHEQQPHCYHLVTIKTAGDLRLFAANGPDGGAGR